MLGQLRVGFDDALSGIDLITVGTDQHLGGFEKKPGRDRPNLGCVRPNLGWNLPSELCNPLALEEVASHTDRGLLRSDPSSPPTLTPLEMEPDRRSDVEVSQVVLLSFSLTLCAVCEVSIMSACPSFRPFVCSGLLTGSLAG